MDEPNIPRLEPVSEIDQQMADQWIPYFQQTMGMPEGFAQELFQAMLSEQKAAAARDRTDSLPERFGDALLERERTEQEIRDLLGEKRADGAADEDIRSWWNLHELERRMICEVDEMHRRILFEKLVQKDKLTEEEAAWTVRRRFPVFGDPEHGSPFGAEDRPIPFELKARVSRYMEKRFSTDPEGFKRDIEAETTMNSFIRAALRKGEI